VELLEPVALVAAALSYFAGLKLVALLSLLELALHMDFFVQQALPRLAKLHHQVDSKQMRLRTPQLILALVL